MKIFFAIRFSIIFLLLSVCSVVDYGVDNFTRNKGGVLFSISYFSVVLIFCYFLILLLSSVFSGFLYGRSEFKISFTNVLLADNLFLYIFTGFAVWLFLTDGTTGVSVAGHEGELVVNGVKTALGWRKATESVKTFILFIIILHILSLLHNYITNRAKTI